MSNAAMAPTAGELDFRGALSILRARGRIPEAEARALLVEGFLSEVLEAIESEVPPRLRSRGCIGLALTIHSGEISHVE